MVPSPELVGRCLRWDVFSFVTVTVGWLGSWLCVGCGYCYIVKEVVCEVGCGVFLFGTSHGKMLVH